jgi:hypothetical protein
MTIYILGIDDLSGGIGSDRIGSNRIESRSPNDVYAENPIDFLTDRYTICAENFDLDVRVLGAGGGGGGGWSRAHEQGRFP